MAGMGLTEENITLLVNDPKTGKPITLEKLNKLFQLELQRGAVMANSAVMHNIYKHAIGDEAGAQSWAKLWTQIRMGVRGGLEVDPETGTLM